MTKTEKTSKKTATLSKAKVKPKLIGWKIDPVKYAAARKPK